MCEHFPAFAFRSRNESREKTSAKHFPPKQLVTQVSLARVLFILAPASTVADAAATTTQGVVALSKQVKSGDERGEKGSESVCV